MLYFGAAVERIQTFVGILRLEGGGVFFGVGRYLRWGGGGVYKDNHVRKSHCNTCMLILKLCFSNGRSCTVVVNILVKLIAIYIFYKI